MPLISSNFTPMFPLQEQLWDKDLNVPLAAGYILFFEDEARTIPKNVYVQTEAPGPIYSYTNIGSMVTLSSIGTTQYLGTDSIIFLYPYVETGTNAGKVQSYFIQVFSSTNILQFTRSNWPFGIASGGEGGGGNAGSAQSANIISNPQFAEVLFNPATGTTVNVTGTTTTPIAPDWNIITTGTGSITVNQIAIIDSLAPGEPAYALDISSASVDSIILSQRITDSPRILEGIFASGTFIGKGIGLTSSAIITMNYVPSLGVTTPIVVGTIAAGSFSPAIIGTTATIIPQTNTNPPSATGYVDIQFVIPPGSHIQISCIQLVGVATAAIQVAYIQESVPRQIDHLFHYYKSELAYIPVPSWLVGWDFPLNPMQFGSTGGALALGAINRSAYIWDQTILFQSVDSSISYLPNANTNGLSITTANTSSFALIQYLPGSTARDILNDKISVALNGFVSTGTGTLAGTVSLMFTTVGSVPVLPLSAIATVNSSGVPTLSAAWDYVPNTLGGNNVAFTLPNATTGMISLSGWDARAVVAINSATYFAIVVSFAPMTAAQAITLNYISMNSGDFATRPAPQTPDEVLRECQYYWQSSFSPGVTPGNNRGLQTGETYAIQYVAAAATDQIPISFKTQMRVTPKYTATVLYNPTSGTVGQILNTVTGASYSASSTANTPGPVPALTTNGIVIQGIADAGSAAGNLLAVHWSVDARLGII